MPEVSIITPCHNALAYLPATARSVLSQTFQDWEWIICDDASKDGSSDFLEDLKRSDARVKVIHVESNQGPSMARNLCIQEAQGKYLAFIDADDLWRPRKLEMQLAFMKERNSALCCSYYRNMDSTASLMSPVIRFPPQTTYENLTGSSVGCLTMMIDRQKIGSVNFQNTPIEDFILWCELTSRGFAIDCLPQDTALYRLVQRSRGRNKLKIALYRWELLRVRLGLKGFQRAYRFLTYFFKSMQKQKKPTMPLDL